MPELIVNPEESAEDKAAQEAHDKRMADVADGKQEPPKKDNREAPPEWLPEKYARYTDEGKLDLATSAQELAKANAELNKQFTQDRQKNKPKDGDETTDDETLETDPAKAEEQAKAILGKELFESVRKEFDEKGELSDEAYQKLEKAGIDKNTVDEFIEGKQAQAQLFAEQAVSVLGGKDPAGEYDALMEWADENLSAEQAEAINDGLTSNNLAKAQMAIQSLQRLYQQAEGRGGSLLGGEAGGSQGVGFRSKAEMTKAISDPRYAKDDAYRAEVIEKIKWTDF